MHSATLLISILSTVLSAGLMTQLAPKRGRRVLPWVLLTVLIGWFAFIPLYLAPKKAPAPRLA